MKRLSSSLICLFILVSSADARLNRGDKAGALDPGRFAERLLELHNKERAAAGARPLRQSDHLTTAAQKYAEYLARHNEFGHAVGSTMSQRIKDAGGKFHAIAENIAKGYRTPEAAVNGWMHSEGHRKNLLNGRYTEAGFGVARSGRGTLIWVVDFGG